jgi:hypothetical protein
MGYLKLHNQFCNVEYRKTHLKICPILYLQGCKRFIDGVSDEVGIIVYLRIIY